MSYLILVILERPYLHISVKYNCLRASQCITLLFIILGRLHMSLSKQATQINQIKGDRAYQSSVPFKGPC